MNTKHSNTIAISAIIFAVLCLLVFSGCGKKAPINYQTLQIQDMSEAEGWDVYMFIAVTEGRPQGEIQSLLEWFRDERFADVNRIRIYVWDNPQAALALEDNHLIAEMEIDRDAGVEDISFYYH